MLICHCLIFLKNRELPRILSRGLTTAIDVLPKPLGLWHPCIPVYALATSERFKGFLYALMCAAIAKLKTMYLLLQTFDRASGNETRL